jgi:hypothetical protein
VHHQEFRTDICRTVELAAKSSDGFGANLGIAGSQIHEVIYVDHQRLDAVFPADGPECLDFQGIGGACAPHARAGGKDLQRVGADLRRP